MFSGLPSIGSTLYSGLTIYFGAHKNAYLVVPQQSQKAPKPQLANRFWGFGRERPARTRKVIECANWKSRRRQITQSRTLLARVSHSAPQGKGIPDNSCVKSSHCNKDHRRSYNDVEAFEKEKTTRCLRRQSDSMKGTIKADGRLRRDGAPAKNTGEKQHRGKTAKRGGGDARGFIVRPAFRGLRNLCIRSDFLYRFLEPRPHSFPFVGNYRKMRGL